MVPPPPQRPLELQPESLLVWVLAQLPALVWLVPALVWRRPPWFWLVPALVWRRLALTWPPLPPWYLIGRNLFFFLEAWVLSLQTVNSIRNFGPQFENWVS
jgi:hypothetical protein